MGADLQAGGNLGMPGAMARLGVEGLEPQMTVPRPRLLPFRQVETPSRVGDSTATSPGVEVLITASPGVGRQALLFCCCPPWRISDGHWQVIGHKNRSRLRCPTGHWAGLAL